MTVSSMMRSILRPALKNLTPDRTVNLVTTNVVCNLVPVLVPWGTALGLAGAWIAWPGLTQSFREENLGDKPLDQYTKEEEFKAYAYRPFNVKNQ